MFQESLEAAQKVRDFLAADHELYSDLGKKLRALNPSVVATVARGSSDHAATYASYLIPLCTGKVVASIPPSLVTVLNAPLSLENQFVLSLSQSGGSPDIVRTLEFAKKAGALTAAIVNDIRSPLAQVADTVLDQHAGKEASIAATKSVLCTMTAVARLIAEWSSDEKFKSALASLPDALDEAKIIGQQLDDCALHDISHAYIISRGLGFGAAAEIALKFKETCGIHAEAFSSAEVRHGPREIVDKKFLVIALALPGSGEESVVDTANELKAQGARVIVVGERGDFRLPKSDFRLSPLVALQLLYPWIARSSVAMGRNPDQPKTLKSKVVQTT